jgi:hypothetical protein
MENEYLDHKFEQWFTMPLNFDDRINHIISDTARLAFKRGYLTPPPTLLERFMLAFGSGKK